MPAIDPLPVLVAYRATEAYGEVFKALQAKLGASSGTDLVERAVAELAAQHGVVLPARVRPWRNGATRAKGEA